MKKILTLIALSALAALNASAAADYISIPSQLSGDAADGNAFLLSNANTQKTSAKTAFELSAIGAKKVSYAMLNVAGTSEDKDYNVSISLYRNGKIAAAKSFKGGLFTAGFVVTNLVNDALKNGEDFIEFTLTQDGVAGAQKDFLLQKATLIAVPETFYSFADYMRPMWKAGKITDESVFFIDEEDGTQPHATLLFKPKKILHAHTILGDKVFEQGKDFTVEGNKIMLTKNSGISARKKSQTYPETQAEADKWKCKFKFAPIKKFGLYNEGFWFHERFVYFTYEHDGKGWDCEKFGEKFDKSTLPNTIEKLEKGKDVKIVLFGDSISNGSNASGFGIRKPFMPSWGDLVADALRAHYKKADITYLNRALGGTTCRWGVKNIESLVAADKPDLVILAFGMNDGINAEARTKSLREMMAKVREKNPNAEFIIVTGMQPNSMWRNLTPHATYPESDKKMQSAGVAVADLWDIHGFMVARKKFIDITGNNVNHPNDFLIRAYAQLVASKLMPLN